MVQVKRVEVLVPEGELETTASGGGAEAANGTVERATPKEADHHYKCKVYHDRCPRLQTLYAENEVSSH
jgi:hypothetical protein